MRYKITLNGRTYEVEVERGEAIVASEYEAAAPQSVIQASPAAPVSAAPTTSAPQSAPTAAGDVIAAPLPGTVLKINISPGEAVKKGQILLLIEAMKMENEIVSPRDGAVAQIVVRSGDAVSTGEPLLVLS